MKQQFTRKLVLLAVMLLAGMGSSFAFEYGGLTYRVVDNTAMTAKVTYQGTDPMYITPYTQSTIVIPSTVPFNGDTYTVVQIGEYAFQNASLSSITIPPTVKSIGEYAFSSCISLLSIDLSNIDVFGSSIFAGCTNLTSVKLPNTMESIPDNFFSGCSNITSFTLPEGVTSIGSGAFYGTGLTSIDIPDAVSSIGSTAFWGTGLTSVTTSASTIGNGAFAYCQNLTNVTLKSGIYFSNAYDNIFGGSDNIKTIVCLVRTSGGNLGFSDNVKENATIYVPKSQMSNWSSFLNVKEATISNVGKHILDVAPYDYNGKVLINGESTDCLYGNTFLIEPDANVEVEFINNSPSDYYEIATFTLNGTDMTSSVVDNKYTIKKVGDNQDIQTTWKEIVSYELNCYANDFSLGTVYANGKELSMYSNSLKFAAGTNISFSITPKSGYGISDFNVNYSDKKSDLIHNSDGSYSYSFTLNSKTELSITYAETWNLTTTFNTGGTVTIGGESVTSGTTKELAGSMTSVEINATSGYEIASVLYNGVEQLAVNTTMWNFWPDNTQGTNQTLAVTFTIVNPTISANYDTMQGSVSIAGCQLMPTMPQSFTIGSNVTFTITPNLGYEISSVMLNGPTLTDITAAVIANGNSYTISSISDSYSIDVMFTAIPTPTSVIATIGTLGMATLYSPYALDFSGVAGLKAYIVSAFTPANNRVILTQVDNVPAKTAVVLVGAAQDYLIPTTSTQTYVANLLKGLDATTTMSSSDGMYTNYILGNGSNGLGFYVVTGGTTVAAGKAYLSLPNPGSPAPSFVMMNLEGADVTGIESIENNAADMAGKAVYNLNGQRQNCLKKGINIVGGKKIVVK